MDKNQTPKNETTAISVLSMNRHAAQAACLTFGETGLVLKGDATNEQIVALAESVTKFTDRLGSARRWWVGDLVATADKRGRDLFEAVAGASQMSAADVQNCASVSRTYPLADRIAGLSWSIHREAAGIGDTKKRREVLEDALASGYGVRQVAAIVRAWKLENGFERATGRDAEPTEKAAPEAFAAAVNTVGIYDVVGFLKHCTSDEALKIIDTARIRISILESGATPEAASDEFDAAFAKLDETLANMTEAA